MKNTMKKLAAVLLALAMTAALMPAVLAVTFTTDETTGIVTNTGSVQVTVKYNGSTPISNAQVALYRVAEGKIDNHNLKFDLVDALQPEGGEAALKLAQDKDSIAALKKAVTDKNLAASQQVTTDSKGLAEFKDVQVGVYLAVQISGGKYNFDPVLLYVPYTPKDNATGWEFTATASPKVSYTGGGTTTPTTPPTTPEKPTEIPDDDTPLVDVPEEDIPLVDIPEEEVPLLPQTGLLQWPVPVMSMAGVLLIALGVLSERKRKGAA